MKLRRRSGVPVHHTFSESIRRNYSGEVVPESLELDSILPYTSLMSGVPDLQLVRMEPPSPNVMLGCALVHDCSDLFDEVKIYFIVRVLDIGLPPWYRGRKRIRVCGRTGKPARSCCGKDLREERRREHDVTQRIGRGCKRVTDGVERFLKQLSGPNEHKGHSIEYWELT